MKVADKGIAVNRKLIHLLIATVLISCGFILTSCKKKPLFNISRTAYILGNNDIKVAKAENVKDVAPEILNSTALIATWRKTGQVKFCSSIHIGPENDGENSRLVMNHHCFAETSEEGKTQKELIEEACTETKVFFGFSEANNFETEVRGCTKGTLKTDPLGDIAVFTLDKPAPEGYPYLEFWDGDDNISERKAVILHHPNIPENLKAPKDEDVKLPVAAITIDDCVTKGRFASTEWSYDPALAFSLKHTCDLKQGSSGSALIDLQTNKILGINWGGVRISYDNGVREDNAATMASYVQAFLSGETEEFIKDLYRISGSSADSLLLGNSVPSEDGTKNRNAKKQEKKDCATISLKSADQSFILLLILSLPLFILSFKVALKP